MWLGQIGMGSEAFLCSVKKISLLDQWGVCSVWKNVPWTVPMSCSFPSRVELGAGRASHGKGFFLKNHFDQTTYFLLLCPKVMICKHSGDKVGIKDHITEDGEMTHN